MSDFVFRGTQSEDPTRSARKALSFTPCLGAALVYSAVPGDPWSRSKELSRAHFLPSSMVHAAVIHDGGSRLSWLWPWMSFGDVLRSLRYEEGGIDQVEALKILNYLARRSMGIAVGGEFKYVVKDEEYEEYEDDEKPWGIFEGSLAWFRKEFEWEPTLECADRLAADTFIFADAPAVSRVADRLGFGSLHLTDVFDAEGAVEDLLGIDDIFTIECVEEGSDLEDDFVPTHLTVRPFSRAKIEYMWHRSSEGLVGEVLKEAFRHGSASEWKR